MARSTAAAVVAPEVAAQELSADEQAQFEAMRDEAPEVEVVPAETIEPQPSPEAEAEVTATRQQSMVPHAALHEERERRKEREKELDTERNRIRILEERTNLLLQNLGRAPQQQVQPLESSEIVIPDVRTDPVGHIVATQQKIQRDLEQMQGGAQAQQQVMQTAQIVSAIQQQAAAREREFQAETPDYQNAINHLKGLEHRRLQLAGYSDPAVRENMITASYLDIAARALQANENPAAKLYEMASLYGYQKPEADAGNGAAAQPTPTPGQRLATVARGQQQNRSLTGTRGAAPVPLTAQRLIEMSESEFARMLDTEEGMALLGT